MPKILVADDDVGLTKSLEEMLKANQYSVDIANNGADASHFIQSFSYDLIILDWDMPEVTGLQLCRDFRKSGGHTPILMLTGKTSLDDKEAGFEAGADDYLTKPFHARELRARMKAILRRPPIYGDSLHIGQIVLDPDSCTVRKGEQEIHMQPLEFALLQFLMRHPNVVFHPDELIRRVWDSDNAVSTFAIYAAVKRIRKKVDTQGEPSIIVTVHGQGYKLRLPEHL